MAWLGKVNLGNLGNLSSDFAGAVTKLSEGVKNIERNFDSALGFEEGSLFGVIGATSSDHQPSDHGKEETSIRKASDEIPAPDSTPADEVPAPDSVVPPAALHVSNAKEDSEASPPDASEENQSPNIDGNGELQHEWEQVDQVTDAESTGTLVDNNVADLDQESSTNSRKTEVEDEEVEAPQTTTTTTLDVPPGDDRDDQPDDEVKKFDMKMMEDALQGAAKQAQMKADEIARLLQENDLLKCSFDEAKKKSADELNALREEYQHRLGAAERKVNALTRERDVLRREQSRKRDESLLLKEKDEIIKQVMAEGEELSKKQAVQEAQIRKLRAQVRELEEEKQRLVSKLQVEEGKVESIRKDKAATEKVLQETIDKGHADLAAQREFYTKIVNEAREAESQAEARAKSQAKVNLDQQLHEASEREMALVQALEELRQGLSRTEMQAAVREDALRKDIEDLESRCQAAETRYDELVAHVPESTRPLLRQIEAMQETSAMRAEAWTGVERALNSRLQEAETKAAAAQERERAINERLSQTLSRVAVMEAQVSCLKAELSLVSRSLEKERLRASENRQEYLAAVEIAATHESRAKQLEKDLLDLEEKHSRILENERSYRASLEKELETVQASRVELENRFREEREGSSTECSGNRGGLRRLSSVDSMDSHDRLFKFGEPTSPQFGKIATLEHYEAFMRQKDGEVSSYSTRLAELESTRYSLAEELVNTTTQCEKLRSEVSAMASLRAELEALRLRHASALELMGERDEQVEELRADLADVKQMYRDQVDLLVGQIERLSSSKHS